MEGQNIVVCMCQSPRYYSSSSLVNAMRAYPVNATPAQFEHNNIVGMSNATTIMLLYSTPAGNRGYRGNLKL